MVSQARHGLQNVKTPQVFSPEFFMKLFITYCLNQLKITIMKSVEKQHSMVKKMFKDKQERLRILINSLKNYLIQVFIPLKKTE